MGDPERLNERLEGPGGYSRAFLLLTIAHPTRAVKWGCIWRSKIDLTRKQREVLQALAAGEVLWKGIMGCHVDAYGDVDWDTFDDLLELGLIERNAARSVGFFRQAFLITDAGRDLLRACT